MPFKKNKGKDSIFRPFNLFCFTLNLFELLQLCSGNHPSCIMWDVRSLCIACKKLSHFSLLSLISKVVQWGYGKDEFDPFTKRQHIPNKHQSRTNKRKKKKNKPFSIPQGHTIKTDLLNHIHLKRKQWLENLPFGRHRWFSK